MGQCGVALEGARQRRAALVPPLTARSCWAEGGARPGTGAQCVLSLRLGLAHCPVSPEPHSPGLCAFPGRSGGQGAAAGTTENGRLMSSGGSLPLAGRRPDERPPFPVRQQADCSPPPTAALVSGSKAFPRPVFPAGPCAQQVFSVVGGPGGTCSDPTWPPSPDSALHPVTGVFLRPGCVLQGVDSIILPGGARPASVLP